MTDSIHGHQVMEMMAESGAIYDKPRLKEAIAAKFGEFARFHTCMGSDLSADDLIAFLSAKGKLIESAAGVSLPADSLC